MSNGQIRSLMVPAKKGDVKNTPRTMSVTARSNLVNTLCLYFILCA